MLNWSGNSTIGRIGDSVFTFFVFVTILMAVFAVLAFVADSLFDGEFDDIGEFSDDEEIG